MAGEIALIAEEKKGLRGRVFGEGDL